MKNGERMVDLRFDEFTADALRKMDAHAVERALSELTDDQANLLLHDWHFWSRPEQRIPPGDWIYWLIKAGRGFGKTRAGAETVRHWVREVRYVNIIGATTDDCRDIMVEGPAGIMGCCTNEERPLYLKHVKALHWPNGARTLIFSADEPDRLRGKQHNKIWADELTAWRYADAWTQVKLGLRIGKQPRAVITTTPRPTRLMKELINDPRTVVTGGATYANRDNLSREFVDTIIASYEGTRLGKQEILGEIIDNNPLALFRAEDIERFRVRVCPPLRRIVVGVDPSASANAESDECGIIAAGLASDPSGVFHAFVIQDASGVMPVPVWSKRSIDTLRSHDGDVIVAEVNNGGDMVSEVMHHVDPMVAVKQVHASRGKSTRAEPIAALLAAGRIHFVGSFPTLEDQLCDYDPVTWKRSPDRMDAFVWAMTELFSGAGDSVIAFYESQKPVTQIEDRKVMAEAVPDKMKPRVHELENAPTQDVQRAYDRAYEEIQAPQTLCDKCGKPVGNASVSDGFKTWHTECRPPW